MKRRALWRVGWGSARALVCAGWVGLATTADAADAAGARGARGVRGTTVALWCIDEPVSVTAGAMLADAGPRGYALILGHGTEIVPGKFGRALQLTNGEARVRLDRPMSIADSKLNLGGHDWTVECWLRLEASVGEGEDDEGTIFEIGSGPRGEDEVVTRFSVLPRENAFALAGVATRPGVVRRAATKTIELPNPEGPPAITAQEFTAMLALGRSTLPRDTWFHVALVHRAAAEELRLFIDGKLQATAPA